MTPDAIITAWLIMLFAVGLGALATHVAIIRLTEWSYEPRKLSPLEQRVKAIKEKRPSLELDQRDFDEWTGQTYREKRLLKQFRSAR